MQRGDRFGSDFGKNQDHQSQRQCGYGNPRISKQPDSNNGGDRRSENIDEIIPDENQADQPVGALEQAERSASATVTRALQVFQTIPVQGHHACL